MTPFAAKTHHHVEVFTLSVWYSPSDMEILIPAYNYPSPGGQFWERLIQSAQFVRITAIVNPGSGPGTTQDANYQTMITRLVQHNIRTIGYVSTSWANRSMHDVKIDIDRWLALYPAIQGFFFDELTADSSAEHLQYYAELREYVRQRGEKLYIVGNPGCCTTEHYCNLVDQIVLFEQHEGFQSFSVPHWASKLTGGFGILRYACADKREMFNTVRAAANSGAKSIYVTDRGAHGSNPWAELPTYWDDFVQAIREPARMVRTMKAKKRKCIVQ